MDRMGGKGLRRKAYRRCFKFQMLGYSPSFGGQSHKAKTIAPPEPITCCSLLVLPPTPSKGGQRIALKINYLMQTQNMASLPFTNRRKTWRLYLFTTPKRLNA